MPGIGGNKPGPLGQPCVDNGPHLLRCGFALEYATLAWNVARIVGAGRRGDLRAVGGAGWVHSGFADRDRRVDRGDLELSGTGEQRQRRGLQLIGYAFAILAVYLLVQSTVVLATGYHPRHSVPGILWTAVTAPVMFALAAGEAHTGKALGNPVLQIEGRVTMIDGILATAVLLGLILNAALG